MVLGGEPARLPARRLRRREAGAEGDRLRQIVSYLLVIILVPIVVRQVRRPLRGIGRPFLWAMNLSHSRLTDWGLGHVEVAKAHEILDVGCGGGRTIRKLAALSPQAKVCGVDYSGESVSVSRSTNAALVEAGRVEIGKASVSHLPFPDGRFDLVTAVETHYYWPSLKEDLMEIRRVLEPGGTLLIIAEHFKGGRFDRLQEIVMKPLGATHLSLAEHRDLFASAGFSDVRTFEEPVRGWMCAVGRKPAAATSGS